MLIKPYDVSKNVIPYLCIVDNNCKNCYTDLEKQIRL